MNEVKVIFGPFSREDGAHYDETKCIAELFATAMDGSLMIDVGAHFGTAMFPFLEQDWSVIAFEPDESNRAHLVERLSRSKYEQRVSLDPRCVSDKTGAGLAFYTSDVSTGISGLSAFHESHVETQSVDAVSLTDFFSNQVVPKVDFLKIDTEGYDLFVLHGYPWHASQPDVIECEFEDSKTVPLGYNYHDLAEFLVSKGYTVYVSEWHPVIRYGVRHNWKQLAKYPCELSNPEAWGNLIGFKSPPEENKLIAAVNKVMKTEPRKAKPAIKKPQNMVKNEPVNNDLIKDIAYLNQLTRKEIQKANEQLLKLAGNQASPATDVASIVSEASAMLGKLAAKVVIVERALQTALPGPGKTGGDSQPVILTDNTVIGADEFYGVSNLLPLQVSPEGIKYRWSGEGSEINFQFDLDRKQAVELQIGILALMKPKFSKQIKLVIDSTHLKHKFRKVGSHFVASCIIPRTNSEINTQIKIKLPAAFSPKELGSGDDTRKMGIAITHLCFTRPAGMLNQLFSPKK